MSLAKLKKDELVALAEANDLSVDPGWTKDEIIDELDSAGIEAETVDDKVSDDTVTANDGHPHVSKAERKARLMRRHDHTA